MLRLPDSRLSDIFLPYPVATKKHSILIRFFYVSYRIHNYRPVYSNNRICFPNHEYRVSLIVAETKRKAFTELNSHTSIQQSHSVDDEHLDLKSLRYIPLVSIKEIACYLSLLEGSRVEDKLECTYQKIIPVLLYVSFIIVG